MIKTRFTLPALPCRLPFMGAIVRHLAVVLFVVMLTVGVGRVHTGRDAIIVALRTGQRRLVATFDRLVFGTVFRNRFRTFLVIGIATINAPVSEPKTERNGKFISVNRFQTKTSFRTYLKPFSRGPQRTLPQWLQLTGAEYTCFSKR